MKTIPTVPMTLTRSLLLAGVGCALAVCSVSAQEDAKATPPQSAGAVDTDPNKGTTERLNTDSTVPREKASEKATNELTNKEKQFINKALAGNAAEVMMADLALQHAESEGVKEFAQMMIHDHKKANAELSKIDDAHGSSVPSPNPDNAEKAAYAKMTELSGSAFDTEYIKHAVADHETDVKEYKEAKGEVKDKMLMAYVDETLPVIENHLKHAKALEKKAPVANH